MQRKMFDVLVSAVGLVVVFVLLVAGGLLMWGYSFANSNVHNQLAEQQIYFPPRVAFAHAVPGTEITPGMIPYLEQYAGQQVLSGPQAETSRRCPTTACTRRSRRPPGPTRPTPS